MKCCAFIDLRINFIKSKSNLQYPVNTTHNTNLAEFGEHLIVKFNNRSQVLNNVTIFHYNYGI